MNDWSTIPTTDGPTRPAGTPEPHQVPPTSPDGPRGERRATVAMVALSIVAVLVATGVLAFVLLSTGVREGTSAASRPNPVPSTTIASTTTTLTTTLATPTTPTPTTADPPIVAGVVSRSCGSSGHGDCFVAVRTRSTIRSPEVVRLSEGSPISIICTVIGESITASAFGRATAVWALVPGGSYVSMAFVDAPGFDPFVNDHPC